MLPEPVRFSEPERFKTKNSSNNTNPRVTEWSFLGLTNKLKLKSNFY